MARAVHGGRALLNLPGHHSTAAIVAEVDDTAKDEGWCNRTPDDGYEMSPEVRCLIADCESRVALEFDLSTANQLENSLYKIDAIVEAFQAFRKGLIVEHHRLQDRLDDFPSSQRDRLYNLRHAPGKRSSILPEDDK